MKTLEERVIEFENKKLDECIAKGKSPSIGITRKQANVVYACNKNGNINVSKDIITDVYNLADVYYKNEFYNQNCRYVDDIVNAVNAIFEKEYEIAQFLLERACEYH